MTAELLKKHFDFTEIENDRMNGFCYLCHRNYKDKKSVYSNFTKHLKRKHELAYKKLFNDNEDPTENNTIHVDHSITTESIPNKAKQARFNMAIAKNLIVKCNMPLSLVENSGFRQFMEECNSKWSPICSKKLKFDYIEQLTTEMQNKITQTLTLGVPASFNRDFDDMCSFLIILLLFSQYFRKI
ncbi:unnamed protein product [Adineta ricciae]|uniref:BED-type domain-containing protein n=1 Tax=Adineta ricciae TaxID=249248 RepID=A0A815K2K1_ADIRI|nr:unnamed protein product [Adineta ricciae]CAF1502686.1 unnamed protein product [Adineta ricciae]